MTGEVFLNTNKTFVIDHPMDTNKYLVHACLEGPEAGVYYRGEQEILNGSEVEIELPYYVDSLATNFTVQVTPIYNGKIRTFNSSRVVNNKFTVYGESGPFAWLVHGKRGNVNVDPNKNDVIVNGDGPYKYLIN
jgi:hypothetical protein